MTRRLQTYEAPGITVTYDPTLCIHAAECVRGLPTVFDPGEKRWIRPERATPDEVERTVARCPTGALRAVRPPAAGLTVTASADRTATPVVVRLQDNGPLLISGPIRIETEAGEVVREADRVALCRCGGTGNPPFCDGSHARRKFRAAR
jgi:uncharacterized Fe-S cluster protein YjdI